MPETPTWASACIVLDEVERLEEALRDAMGFLQSQLIDLEAPQECLEMVKDAVSGHALAYADLDDVRDYVDNKGRTITKPEKLAKLKAQLSALDAMLAAPGDPSLDAMIPVCTCGSDEHAPSCPCYVKERDASAG